MSVSVGALIVRAEMAMDRLGHSPSTRWQYRWAWSQIEVFCSERGGTELTGEVVAVFLEVVAEEHAQGRIKEWKRKLLRKAVLVLCEVARTGTYTWSVSRVRHRNEALDGVFRPVQEQFEGWLTGQGLAAATQELYAVVGRKVLAWLPQRGITDVAHLSPGDVSAAVIFLGGSYQPGSMRTAVTALRVLCRFLEDTGRCAGLSRTVPPVFTRRVRAVAVLPAHSVAELVNSPDPGTPTGCRDRAILLLAARTGLRPSDIAGLRLGDIDWRHARITVTQHKTATVLTLPLLADVGAAIAEYLLHSRPAGTGDDHVFLRSQAPHVGFAATDLYHVAAGAFTRTHAITEGGTGRGMRVLRASLATRMAAADTPLPVIAGVLGHRGTESAKHYLAGDEARMRQCCLDFVGIEPAGPRP